VVSGFLVWCLQENFQSSCRRLWYPRARPGGEFMHKICIINKTACKRGIRVCCAAAKPRVNAEKPRFFINALFYFFVWSSDSQKSRTFWRSDSQIFGEKKIKKNIGGSTSRGPSAAGPLDVPNIWESELQYLGVV
jgi:hypothetical protein